MTAVELMSLGLTPSEARVGELVLKGWTNRQVATALFITEKTSKFHCTNIFKKFQVKSRSQFIVKFLQPQPHSVIANN